MPTDAAHYVFVDFENVPSVDLALVEQQPVHVTLLIGEKQKKLELTLVRQIHRHAAQVTLVEVGASGRNALDLVLACHLGQTLLRQPGAAFHIISKDKDFNPLIAHLRASDINVTRHDSFAALPFLAPAHRAPAAAPRALVASPRAPAASPRPPAATRRPPVAKTAPRDERFDKLIDRLQHSAASRPVRRKTLLSHVHDFYAGRLPAHEVESIVSTLEHRGVIAIDERGRVSYP